MKYILATLLLLSPSFALAQDHWEDVQPYLSDDVVAVAYLDLWQIDTIGALEWADKLGFGPEPEHRKAAIDLMLKIQERIGVTTEYGAHYVYVLFRVDDLQQGGPTWIFPIKQDGKPRAVLGMLLSGKPGQFEIEDDLRPWFFPKHCEVHNSVVIGANSPQQLQQIKASQPATQLDLKDAWETLGLGDCGLIVFADQDTRRVVGELFPKFPAPFEAIDGQLIANRLRWAGFSAKLPPRTGLQLVVQTDAKPTAEIVEKALSDGLALLKAYPSPQPGINAADREAITSLLQPEIIDNQVLLSFDGLLSDLDRIARLLTPPVAKLRQDSQRHTRINKFKQIALGILNYASARGSFPPRASLSEEGKPLLSWRVHILPYMDLGDLYELFHLDEPWNSEHNKQLIPLMPEIYMDPDPAMARRNSQGRTSFVVPTGPGTLYEGPNPPMFKDIKDGTSNTIMLLEVIENSAPIWTRPKDWSPTKISYEKLRREDRDWITTAYCDGSVSIYPFATPVGILRELISPNGGGVVNRP